MSDNPDYVTVSPAYPPRGRLYNAVWRRYDRREDCYTVYRISLQLTLPEARARAIAWAADGKIDYVPLDKLFP